MQVLVATEIVSIVIMAIGMLGLFGSGKKKRKSTYILLHCCFAQLLWNGFDAASYLWNNCGINNHVMNVITFLAYTMGGIAFLGFAFYCKVLIEERTEIKNWVMYVPIVLLAAAVLFLSINIFMGNIFRYENGICMMRNNIPVFCDILGCLAVAYIPIVSIIQRKDLGRRATFFLCFYFFVPLVAVVQNIIIGKGGYDFTPVGGALALLVVCALVQTRLVFEKDAEYQELLKDSNNELLFFNSELKRQLDQIKQLNEKLSDYNSIVTNAGYGIWHVLHTEGEKPKMQVNAKMAELLDIDTTNMTEEEIYSCWFDNISAESLPSVIEFEKEMLAGKNTEITYSWMHPQKGVIYVRSGGVAMEMNKGCAIFSGYHADVTDTVKKEQKYKKELEEAKELAEAHNLILEEQLDIINSVSKAFNYICYLDMKDHNYFMLGYDDGLRIERNSNSIVSYDTFESMYKVFVIPEHQEIMREFTDLSTVNERLKDRQWISCQCESTNDGWIEAIIIAARRNENGTVDHIIWATRNINEEKKRELAYRDALELATASAEAANEAKTTFLFNMSHDIRTPMNAILGFSNLMEREINNPELMKNYLGKVKDSGQYLLTLINNLLEIARIDSGKETFDESFVDLMDESCSIAPLLESEITKKKLHFSNDMNIQHRYVMADMQKIKEITMNLLSNAIKYTPEEGNIHLHFEEIPCDREGYATYVNTITDNGIGMSEEFVEVIFDSFSRERNTTESKISGTGLGMSIVKKLVDLMGGTIDVKSELGKGTSFSVTLDHKIVDEPEKYLEKQSNVISEESIDICGKHILLAEDNEINAEIAVALLETAGAVIDWVEDGVECVNRLVEKDADYYDLILMDIQMPNLNGYDATRRIRKLNDEKKANIPIIAMTANAFDEDKKNALAAGMNAHISKPIEVKKMMQTLGEFM